VIEVTDHERSVGTLLVHNLSACQEEGLRLSLDDFGDTTTDLSVLASLPFDFVKIDMGVIRGDEDVRRRLILGLLVVAREIGARLLAEGVETRDELRLVTELGFEAAQGYFIKDPGPSPLLPAHVELIPAS
jgi:EAL domain-containing protein (putative c-di-GMP-specific phosphodiesterase class I)